MSNNDPANLLENPPQSNRVEAFAPHEIISCGKCSRNNPPNRLACLYCGSQLEPSSLNTEKIALNFRKPEPYEKGFNVVIWGVNGEPRPGEMERLFSIDPALLEEAERSAGVPLLRTENEVQAELVRDRFNSFGYSSVVVPDESLQAEVRPLRVRG